MAVFYNTGGGDIYAGPDREAVLKEMRFDCGDIDETEIFEVSGDTKMSVEDEEGRPSGELSTLAEEYEEQLGSYCIASDNC